jgi:hypothetical protein
MYQLSANGWKVVSYVAMQCLRLYPERDFARQNPGLAALHNDLFKMGMHPGLPPTDDRPYRNVTGEFGEAQRFAVLSLDQLCHGVRTEKGRFRDYGTGLSKSSVAEAVNEAIAEGILLRKRQKSSVGRDLGSLYGINWDLVPELNWWRAKGKKRPNGRPRQVSACRTLRASETSHDG